MAGLVPHQALPAEVDVPVSKSVAQRALLCAALTHGSTSLLGIDQRDLCDDVRAALDVTKALGAGVRVIAPRALAITGHSPAHSQLPATTLYVGESGTLARLATAIAGLCMRGETTVTGSGSLLPRTSPALFEALLLAGSRLRTQTTTPSGGWPVAIRGIGPPSDLYLNEPKSSQELTALLLVAASYPDAIRVHLSGPLPSATYFNVTKRVLATFGVHIQELPTPHDPKNLRARQVFEAAGVLTAPSQPFVLDADASAAAVALTAGALTGQALSVRGAFEASAQGDLAIVDWLCQMGAQCESKSGQLSVAGALSRGLDADLSATPDLVAPLAAAALGAAWHHGATSRLAGLGTLRHKESDRLAVLSQALRAVGVEAEVGGSDHDPNLTIGPLSNGPLATGPHSKSSAPLQPSAVCLDPHNDHRMAFAFALFGLVRPGITVATPEVVAKSWPKFWSMMDRDAASAS